MVLQVVSYRFTQQTSCCLVTSSAFQTIPRWIEHEEPFLGCEGLVVNTAISFLSNALRDITGKGKMRDFIEGK